MNLTMLPQNAFKLPSHDDPLKYYFKPLIKNLFRGRLSCGLDLLRKTRYPRILEIGYGSGILLPTLSKLCDELHGLDIHLYHADIEERLREYEVACNLVKGDIYSLPYENNFFDLVIAFSIFEHLHDPEQALRELTRVLKKDGEILIGIPRLDKLMEIMFILIGYFSIKEHHVLTERQIESAIQKHFKFHKCLFPKNALHLYTYYHCVMR